jgi:hypothetical protein
MPTENPCILSPIPADAGGLTTYCGPAAIAALTGLPVASIEDAVLQYRRTHAPARRTRGRRGKPGRVAGMFANEMAPVLDLLGYRAVLAADYVGTRTHARPCLDRHALTHARGDVAQLVIVTGHGVALHRMHVVDTRHRVPTHVYGTRGLQQKRVLLAWDVIKKEEAGHAAQ